MRSHYDENIRTRDRFGTRVPRDDDRGMFDFIDDRHRHRSQIHSNRSDDFEKGRDSDSNRRRERDHDYGPDSRREEMPRNETERLIASSKVEGTPVYDRDGNKLGSICTLMVDKRSGQTEYAVLKYNSDFLGLKVNERYYPLEWRELTYDRRMHGYGVDFTEEGLEDRVGYSSEGHRKTRESGDRQRRSAAWS